MTTSSIIGDLFSSKRTVTRFALEAIVVEGLAADQNAGEKTESGGRDEGGIVRAREREVV